MSMRVRRARPIPPARPLLLFVALTAPAAGCATKGDVRDLGDRIGALQARQDSLFAALQDSLSAAVAAGEKADAERVAMLRGEVGYRLIGLGEQLVQLLELAGQSHTRITELRRELEAQRQDLLALGTASPDTSAPVANPEQLLAVARRSLERGAFRTARTALERLLAAEPPASDAHAVEARELIAESYAAEGQRERAVEEFARVAELYAESERVPRALLRAGAIAEELGQNDRARTLYRKIVEAYEDSPEAALAREALERLG